MYNMILVGALGAIVRQVKSFIFNGKDSLVKEIVLGNIIVGALSGQLFGCSLFTSFCAGLTLSYLGDNSIRYIFKHKTYILNIIRSIKRWFIQ